MRLILSFFVLLCLGTTVYAENLLPGSVEYDVLRNSYHLGSTKKSFHYSNNHLTVKATTQAEGLLSVFFPDQVTETSEINLSDNQVVAQSYAYKKTGNKPDQFSVSFDQQKKLIQHSRLGEENILGDAQDLLSFQVAMMYDLQQGKKQLKYFIADKKRFRQYDLKITGKTTMVFTKKKLPVVVLEYIDKQKKEKFTFWCAPEMNFLPVKTVKTENDGDVIELRLRRYNQTAYRMKTEEEEW